MILPLVGTVVLAAGQLLAARPALGAVTCSLDSSTHIASASVAPDTLDVLIVRGFSGHIMVGGADCGAASAVDRVDLDLENSFARVEFSLANGGLAPGHTPEGDGSSEIEFVMMHVAAGSEFGVRGASGNDQVMAGVRYFQGLPIGERINLNGQQDLAGGTYDDDVLIPSSFATMNFRGGTGNDSITGLGTGAAGSRPLLGKLKVTDEDGADLVIGGNGNDVFLATEQPDEADTFRGGPGTDQVSYPRITAVSVTQDGDPNDGAATEHDDVGGDIERILTGLGNDTVVAGPGAQFIFGNGGTNTLFGGPGNDLLSGGNGPDEFHGGAGRDLVSYDPREDAVTVTIEGTANDGRPGEGDNVEPDVEGAIGSKAGDQFTGNANANWLYGAGGDDILLGGVGNDHLFGGLPASSGTFAADGSDVFFGGAGKDVVDESNHTGNLQLSIDSVQNDAVAGQPGQGVDNIREDVETVIGGDGNDTITGSGAANRLVGGAGADAMNGLGGADVLVPGGGQDTLSGGPGPDTASYAGAAAGITANLAQGTATGDGDDVLASMERLGGSGHDDDLTGSGLANVVSGGAGNDQLAGLAQNDTLKGGPGNDDMNGGPGTDTCKQGPGTGTKSGCEH